MSDLDFDRAFAGLFRESYGRITSVLAKEFRDLELAEDAAQEAMAVASRKWPSAGIPANAAGWLYVVARRKAIDALRKAARQKRRAIQRELESSAGLNELPAFSSMAGMYGISPPPDERLSLIFACCHPGIEQSAQVALTLHSLSGLNTREIAAGFLIKEATVSQRIVRAKRKIKAAGIPFAIPDLDQWPDRVDSVLSVIYLIFNAGYIAHSGHTLVKTDLCEEAIFLSRMLVDLLSNQSEVEGLLALLLFQHSRRSARIHSDGSLVLLKDQDRSKWDRKSIREAEGILSRARKRSATGPYLLQAEIAGVHGRSQKAEDTDWHQILQHYDDLVSIHPTPVVWLNRAVAVRMAQGPDQALQSLDANDMKGALNDYRYYHSTRAEFLLDLGRTGEANSAFARALELTENEQERKHLEERMAAVNRR
ncbi:MAG: RNA polymerase subunit sigma-24 [Leptospiraceae bacterium]|nr:RNA polymerase subunit sigma-24 [Leptospiraceae bacterium]